MMNLFEHAEKERKLLISGIVIISLAILAVTARRNPSDYDAFWHLRMGLDWLESGLSFWRDNYSFTFAGDEIKNPPFIFEILLAWLVNQFGVQLGFEAYKFVGFFLVFGLMFLFLRQVRASTLIYCLVLPFLAVLLQLRPVVRPELLGYSFSVVAMMLYFHAGNRLTISTMLPITILLLVWNNYHAPIIGYIIFFGLFVDVAFKLIRERAKLSSWLEWMGWGLTLVAIGFITPGFHHPLIPELFFSSDWAKLIQEYLPTPKLYGNILQVQAMALLTIFVLCQALLKRRFGLFAMCGFLAFFAWKMSRLVTPGGIVVLCSLAWLMSETDLLARLEQLPIRLVNATGVLTICLIVLAVLAGVATARDFMTLNGAPSVYPEDVADYMENSGISGKIFNDLHTGGYLLYRLAPESRVYIDGRTNILYPIEHLQRNMAAVSDPGLLAEEINKYDIKLAVLNTTIEKLSVVKDSKTLDLDFVGAGYSLFRSGNPNFPIFGNLLVYPACWDSNQADALRNEQSRAIWLLPQDSTLLPFIQIVMDFTNATDKVSFFGALKDLEELSEFEARFVGYQALKMDMNQFAYDRFDGIEKKEVSDFLAAALAKTKMSDWRTAEQILDTATKTTWPRLIYSNLFALQTLLSHIRDNSGLTIMDEDYLDRLSAQLGTRSNQKSSMDLDIKLFCPDK